MFRKDDPAFKKLADDTIAGLAKSGELAKLYDKWFVQATPPKNTKLGMPASDANKDAWKNLNDKPVEAYAKK
jgi:glutamate/aspartate transport system substrate-binding protein